MSSAILLPSDPNYPLALSTLPLPDTPPTLYIRGCLPTAPGIAIVGTRKATVEAEAFARSLAASLAAEGFALWSGGAVGIDAACHQGALDAGGVTVVVAGGGLDRPYPPQHEGLYRRVIDCGGALVSRMPDGTPPMAPWFLKRNHLLAALTVATVVIEAGVVSGARSTAAAARRLGRPLCVVPHAPWSPHGGGCAIELARGAVPVLGVADVLAALGRPRCVPSVPGPHPVPRRRGRTRPLGTSPSLPLPVKIDNPVRGASSTPTLNPQTPEETAVFAVLGDAPLHVDAVCDRTSLPLAATVAALLTLTLRSVVVEGPAGFFRRAPLV